MSVADDKPKESGNAEQDKAAEPGLAGRRAATSAAELYRALRSYCRSRPPSASSPSDTAQSQPHTLGLDRLAADRAYLLS